MLTDIHYVSNCKFAGIRVRKDEITRIDETNNVVSRKKKKETHSH